MARLAHYGDAASALAKFGPAGAGAGAGFLVGGPVGAAIGAGAGYFLGSKISAANAAANAGSGEAGIDPNTGSLVHPDANGNLPPGVTPLSQVDAASAQAAISQAGMLANEAAGVRYAPGGHVILPPTPAQKAVIQATVAAGADTGIYVAPNATGGQRMRAAQAAQDMLMGLAEFGDDSNLLPLPTADEVAAAQAAHDAAIVAAGAKANAGAWDPKTLKLLGLGVAATLAYILFFRRS